MATAKGWKTLMVRRPTHSANDCWFPFRPFFCFFASGKQGLQRLLRLPSSLLPRCEHARIHQGSAVEEWI